MLLKGNKNKESSSGESVKYWVWLVALFGCVRFLADISVSARQRQPADLARWLPHLQILCCEPLSSVNHQGGTKARVHDLFIQHTHVYALLI